MEKITFKNHTACHCVNKQMLHKNQPQLLKRATVITCNCPKYFEKILQDNGECRCDCSSENIACNSMKDGYEHFSMEDRK